MYIIIISLSGVNERLVLGAVVGVLGFIAVFVGLVVIKGVVVGVLLWIRGGGVDQCRKRR